MSQAKFQQVLEEQPWKINMPMNWHLDMLNLTPVSLGALQRAGLETVGDVARASFTKLCQVDQFGYRSFRELLLALQDGPRPNRYADAKYQRDIEKAKEQMAAKKQAKHRETGFVYDRGETPAEVAKYATSAEAKLRRVCHDY